MAARTIRVRVHAGNLERLDVLPLPEGSEMTVVIEMPEDPVTTVEQPTALRLGSYPLGAPVPLTRAEFYDDDH